MATLHANTVSALLASKSELSTAWVKSLEASGATRNLKEDDIKQQTNEFLSLLTGVLQHSGSQNINQ